MNTDKLAKHYGGLTPRERLPLIMAAAGRDDEHERQKLVISAPKVTFRTPDFFGLAQAFSEISHLHFMELMHLAAAYLETLGAADEDENEEDEFSRRFLDIALAFGYLFNVNLAGWRQFCAEHHIDPELPWSFLPGFDRIKRTEELAKTAAFVSEGMVRFMARKDNEPGQLVTADSIAAGLRRCLEIRAEWWG